MTKFIVDANWLVHRTFWSAKDSIPRRFAMAIEKNAPQGSDIVLAWDDSENSWRRDLYPGYKRGRSPKPRALAAALRDCRKAAGGFVAAGMEGDDLVATFAREAVRLGNYAVIFATDKDLMQLVGPRCLMTDGHDVYDEAAVCAKWRIDKPDQMPYLLSYAGDRIDGLPGLPGCGYKRAADAAREYRIGNALTFELAQLADVPQALIKEA